MATRMFSYIGPSLLDTRNSRHFYLVGTGPEVPVPHQSCAGRRRPARARTPATPAPFSELVTPGPGISWCPSALTPVAIKACTFWLAEGIGGALLPLRACVPGRMRRGARQVGSVRQGRLCVPDRERDRLRHSHPRRAGVVEAALTAVSPPRACQALSP